jgi:hypothetical protein
MTQSKPPFERADTFAPSALAHHDARGQAVESPQSTGRIVNEYQPALPGVACGLAAVAMAAITFGLLVVAPATIESGSQAIDILPASQALAMRPAEIVTAAAPKAAAEIEPAVACDNANDKANRSRRPETHCPQGLDGRPPSKSDSRGAGCLDVS